MGSCHNRQPTETIDNFQLGDHRTQRRRQQQNFRHLSSDVRDFTACLFLQRGLITRLLSDSALQQCVIILQQVIQHCGQNGIDLFNLAASSNSSYDPPERPLALWKFAALPLVVSSLHCVALGCPRQGSNSHEELLGLFGTWVAPLTQVVVKLMAAAAAATDDEGHIGSNGLGPSDLLVSCSSSLCGLSFPV